ncbi:MAG TPA: hypothetical protein VGW78_01925 [Candidatus Babeliales bacterium]|nr:hypothetical protein [Candidatus Babeliales bacterium]
MIEMVISLALFLVICTLYVSMQTHIHFTRARSFDYCNAITIASNTIQEIRANKQSIGTYTYTPYTIQSTIQTYAIPNKEIIHYLEVIVSWPEKSSQAKRSYIVTAYYTI